jgi:hypothetical protein
LLDALLQTTTLLDPIEHIVVRDGLDNCHSPLDDKEVAVRLVLSLIEQDIALAINIILRAAVSKDPLALSGIWECFPNFIVF